MEGESVDMLIASTENYSIRVDKKINRLYIVLRGFWLDPSKTPEYVNHLAFATESFKSPFTALVDVREMRTPGHLVKEMHVEAQKVTIAAGLVKTAEVFPAGISKELELEGYALVSNLTRRGFKSMKKAEEWLNQSLEE